MRAWGWQLADVPAWVARMRGASSAPAAAAAVRGLAAAVDQGLRMDGPAARASEALHPKKPSTPAPSPHYTLLQRPSAGAGTLPRHNAAQAPSEPSLAAACWRASGGLDTSTGQQPVAVKAGFATMGSGPRSPGSEFAEGHPTKRAKRAAGAGEETPAGVELQCGYRGR